MRDIVSVLVLVLITTLGLTPQSHAQVSPGDILATDLIARVLFRIDPTTGNRTVISDFGNPSQGTSGIGPSGVTLDASGSILVTTLGGSTGKGVLFRIDPTTGNRTVISDFGNNAQGPLGEDPLELALDASGNILVIDINAGTNSIGALFRVDPTTGNRTVISDFGNNAQGTLGVVPQGVTVDASGNIMVIDSSAGTEGRGALFRVNPTTGNRTILSDFGGTNQGTLGKDPLGVALDASGSILVIDDDAGTEGRGMIFRVNPANGNRTVVNDLGNPSQGTLGGDPGRLALDASGNIVVMDFFAGTNFIGALFRVDPTTGNRTAVSDFGDTNQGTLGRVPLGVAIVPSRPNPGDILVMDPDAGGSGRGALFGVDPLDGTHLLISNFGNPSQGPLGVDPFGLAFDASGNILVIDEDAGTDIETGNVPGALFRINPTNGHRTLLSDFGNGAQGTFGADPFGLALDSTGSILITDDDAGPDFRGFLFRVDPSNGNRTLVSDFGDSNQGPLGVDPRGVALGSSGSIFVIDSGNGTDGRGALFRVNPSNGSRTLVSDFGDANQGPLGNEPIGLALDSSGNVLVADRIAGTDGRGLLFRVNPTNGNRTILSNFGNSAQGTLGSEPFGVALDSSGTILVVDTEAGTGGLGGLFAVNPSSGNRILISDFGDPSLGIAGFNPAGVIAFFVRCGGLEATIIGTPGGDVINGTPGADVIAGLGGKDTINAQAGNDIICGGLGDDILIGGPGNDRMFGQRGFDTLKGGIGDDILSGGGGNDILNGNQGLDTLNGDSGNDTLNGGLGSDVLNGGIGNDTLNGNGGNDILRGNGGDDALNGGIDTDTCNGGPQTDTAIGCENVINVP